MSYAEKTSVSSERTKAEIERMLERYGADQFVSGWERGNRSMIQFRADGRIVRFVVAMPDEQEFVEVRAWGSKSAQRRRAEMIDQETRRRWRALSLVIKAKLEAVSTGITTFETEFLAHIVMPDGQTVADHVLPRIESAYATGKLPALMPGY